jgi:hypothetical protein
MENQMNTELSNVKKKKRDIIFIGVLLVVALIAFFVVDKFIKKDGNKVVIKVDGEIVKIVNLTDTNNIIVNGYDGGTNTVVIENGTVYMTEADCPDKICVNTGKISKIGETIVCLPHRVVVEIQGEVSQSDSDDSIDSVVK